MSTQDKTKPLSEMEKEALFYLEQKRSVLLSEIDDKNTRDCFGFTTPGLTVFKKLVKRGLVMITEEEPVDLKDKNGNTFEFTFTPMVELTTEGWDLVASLRKGGGDAALVNSSFPSP